MVGILISGWQLGSYKYCNCIRNRNKYYIWLLNAYNKVSIEERRLDNNNSNNNNDNNKVGEIDHHLISRWAATPSSRAWCKSDWPLMAHRRGISLSFSNKNLGTDNSFISLSVPNRRKMSSSTCFLRTGFMDKVVKLQTDTPISMRKGRFVMD